MEVVIVAGALVFVNIMTVLLAGVAMMEFGRRLLKQMKSLLDERDSAKEDKVTECVRMCVTLKHNEGEFIALCIERSSKRWSFEQAVTVPGNIGTAAEKIEGTLRVPPSNILMWQELTEIHDAPNE